MPVCRLVHTDAHRRAQSVHRLTHAHTYLHARVCTQPGTPTEQMQSPPAIVGNPVAHHHKPEPQVLECGRHRLLGSLGLREHPSPRPKGKGGSETSPGRDTCAGRSWVGRQGSMTGSNLGPHRARSQGGLFIVSRQKRSCACPRHLQSLPLPGEWDVAADGLQTQGWQMYRPQGPRWSKRAFWRRRPWSVQKELPCANPALSFLLPLHVISRPGAEPIMIDSGTVWGPSLPCCPRHLSPLRWVPSSPLLPGEEAEAQQSLWPEDWSVGPPVAGSQSRVVWLQASLPPPPAVGPPRAPVRLEAPCAAPAWRSRCRPGST